MTNINKKVAKPLISIIMPVWNVEKYLKQAINSVQEQTYKNWELLLIDDGSEDDSLKICHELAKEDERIYVFSKENRGVSNTRNFGIKRARGEWLYFIDADDWIEKECLEQALKKAVETKSDIVCWNFYQNTDEIQKREKPIRPEEQYIDKPTTIVCAMMFPQYYEKMNDCFLGPIRCPWNKFIKKSLVLSNGIFFDETMKIGEDALFSARCFEKAERAVLINKYWYHYRLNIDSANTKYRSDVFEVYQNAMKGFLQAMEDRLDDVVYATSYKGMIWSYVNRVLDKNVIHEDNPYGLRKRIKDLKTFLLLPNVKKAFEIQADDSAFRYDQKIMFYFMRHECAEMLILFQKTKNVMRLIRRKGRNLNNKMGKI